MPEQSQRDGSNFLVIDAADLEPGMELNTHQDVFWEVVAVRESERHPGDIEVELVHDRRYTFAPTDSVVIAA